VRVSAAGFADRAEQTSNAYCLLTPAIQPAVMLSGPKTLRESHPETRQPSMTEASEAAEALKRVRIAMERRLQKAWPVRQSRG
jgi:hypothetical protein